jgi:hypothetical protein
LRQEDFNPKGGLVKKLSAVVMTVLTSLGLAWVQARNHDSASPTGPLHWGTVTPSDAMCGDSIIESAPPPSVQFKPAPPTPIAVEKQELGEPSWDPQWDEAVERALSPEMLSPGMAWGVMSYCPLFASMSDPDKRAFWAYTFQALAGAEAGLKPTTNVRHTEPEVAKVDTVTKRMVRQQGLLQLAYMDAQRYGCDFNWQHDRTLPEKDPARTILQPENNLLCGVKIMEHQMLTQRKPLLSSTSYWVTLRPATLSYKVFAKQMKNVPAECSNGMPPEEKAKNRQPRETRKVPGATTVTAYLSPASK